MKRFPGFSPEKIRKGDYSRSVAAPLLVLAVFLLLTVAGRIDTALTRENEYAAELLMQILIFLFPAVVYLSVTGNSLKTARLRPVGAGHLLLMLSALVILICGNLLIGLLCGGYDTLSGGYDLYGIFVAKNDGGAKDVVYLILAYAVLPAICEEFVFRSVLSAEYEKKSVAAAILMPALFFAMLHFDLEHFPSLFFSGLVLSLMMYASRTVFASVLVHILFNLASVFGKPYFQTAYDLGGEGFFVFLITSLFLFFSFLFCAEAARLYRGYADRNYSSAYREPFSAEKPAENAPFSERHPKWHAFLTSLLSPTAMICYVYYAAAILL